MNCAIVFLKWGDDYMIPELFMNYILWLHVKSFILARWNPSFLLPGSRFFWMKLSHVITSARLSGMKMLVNTSFWKNQKKYISIDRRFFFCILRRIWRQSMRKKIHNCIYKILSFWEKKNRHGWRKTFFPQSESMEFCKLTYLQSKIERKHIQIPGGTDPPCRDEI